MIISGEPIGWPTTTTNLPPIHPSTHPPVHQLYHLPSTYTFPLNRKLNPFPLITISPNCQQEKSAPAL